MPLQPYLSMNQIELFNIPSPCKRVCKTNTNGLCIGCYRNRYERLNWNHFSNEERRTVLKKCLSRKIIILRNAKNKDLSTSTSPQGNLFNLIDYED